MGKNKHYLSLAFVIVVWGFFPVVTVGLFDYMSAGVYTALSALISAISFTMLGWKKRRELNKKYILTAGITGLCYSAATILQLIGLQYTTPSMYAFLENTSCVLVPVLLFWLARKKPSALTILASLVCLGGCFVLSGVKAGGGFGIGEILCGLAGLLFSGNIVGTGLYAREMDTSLYLMVQKWIHTIVSVAVMLVTNFWLLDGVPVERMWFIFDPLMFLGLAAFSLISSTFCWILRTRAVVNLDINFVSVAMPMSAVITMILSVLVGSDAMSASLVGGAVLITGSVILSAFGSREAVR